MQDISKIADLITVMKTIKDAGYAPTYLENVWLIPDDSEYEEAYATLHLLDIIKKKDTPNYTNFYHYTVWVWGDDPSV